MDVRFEKRAPQKVGPVDGHAPWAWGTWVQDRLDHRSALLGFVVEAYLDKLVSKSKKGANAPYELSPVQQEKRRQESAARRSAANEPPAS